jgi:propanol-preferring alcohol dehydrogenase
MKAAIQERANRPMVIKDIPTPSPGAGEVLVRVKAVGVCHSDIHIADGLFESFGVDLLPRIMGHEIAGIVEETGDDVMGVTAGQRVGVYIISPDGTCSYCQMGQEECCVDVLDNFATLGFGIDGGYAEYVKVPADTIVSLPEDLDYVDAAPFFCAGLTVYSGLKNAGLQPGQRVAVLGIGGLGHLAIQVAKALGAEVIAVSSTETKAEPAQLLGASDVISAGTSSGKRLLEMGGVHIVLSTTVDGDAIAPTIQGLLPLGTLVLLGLTTVPFSIVPITMIGPQHRIIGSNIGSRRELFELFDLTMEHNIRPITETYLLDEANAVFDRLRANQVRFRAVLILK